MKIYALAVVAALSALVTGCSTTPVPDARAEQVRPLQAMLGDAELIVTRDSGLTGAMYDARLFLDGVRIANLRPSEQVHLPVQAGYHQIGVATAVDPNPQSAVELDLRSGETRRYRVVVLADHFAVVPTR
ncbi:MULTISPECIES: hypothetical protein [Paraburkholderia]|uniref:Lipoprotein n=1 Tax=Paraburkholderia madseniana TaxID=2599607 RepID=A0AAP5EU41_9BURK|nr:MULTISPECIES: hypothetical protein [Paraburkholderia]MCX4151988.1 hypothetical protein [Paraburkholderia madseniana]MDN7154916.1 hypothetical protein [Paraburkholderia sp. WS6]MDQ6413799.1 hypothetical protein [Paraburkholderia madseniana]